MGPHRRVRLDSEALTTRERFHDACSEALGFPSFYGRNGNAWIDCLGAIDMPAHRMTAVHVPVGGTLIIEIAGLAPQRLDRTHPMAKELLQLTTAVNERFKAGGSATRVSVAFVQTHAP